MNGIKAKTSKTHYQNDIRLKRQVDSARSMWVAGSLLCMCLIFYIHSIVIVVNRTASNARFADTISH